MRHKRSHWSALVALTAFFTLTAAAVALASSAGGRVAD